MLVTLWDSVCPSVQMVSDHSRVFQEPKASSVDVLPPHGVVILPVMITVCPRVHPRSENRLPEGILLFPEACYRLLPHRTRESWEAGSHQQMGGQRESFCLPPFAPLPATLQFSLLAVLPSLALDPLNPA